MKKNNLLLTGLVLLFGATCTFGMTTSDKNLNISLGQKSLDSDDWGDGDTQLQIAVDADYSFNLPVNIAFGVSYSQHTEDQTVSGVSAESKYSSTEIRLGARKYMDVADKTTVTLGAGAALISAGQEVTLLGLTLDANESGVGFYAEAAAQYNFTDKYHVGAKVDYSAADIEFSDETIAGGGLHYGVFFGSSF